MEEKLPVGVGAEGRNLAEGRKLDNRRIPPRAEEVWVKGHGDVAGGGRGISLWESQDQDLRMITNTQIRIFSTLRNSYDDDVGGHLQDAS